MRMRQIESRFPGGIALALCLLAPAGCVSVGDPAPLPKLLTPGEARLLRRIPGQVHLSIVHVESGLRLSILGDQPSDGSLSARVAWLAAAAARAKEGDLEFRDRWTVRPSALAAPAAGRLAAFDSGLTPTVADLLRLAVTESDEVAARVVAEQLDPSWANTRMETLGLGAIRLPIAANEKGGASSGSVSANALSEFLRRISTGSLFGPEHDARLRRILRFRAEERLPQALAVIRDPAGELLAGPSESTRRSRIVSGVVQTRKGRFAFALIVEEPSRSGSEADPAGRALAGLAARVIGRWEETLPELKVLNESPTPSLAFRLPRVELSPLEATSGALYLERVFRPTDREFWRLYEVAGGNVPESCLVPMPNSWWEGNDPQKIEPVSALILHHTSEETDEDCIALFQKPESLVSSHFLVGRDGRLYQFVSLEHRSWHAGVSLLHGRPSLNRTSIGVEISGDGNKEPFTPAQIETTIRVVGILTSMFDLKAPWIAGHQHIAPDRKDDPGELFPWNEVERQGLDLAERLGQERSAR